MAKSKLCRDTPFDPKNKMNILIKLKESDTGSSNTITMSKELVEAKIFPWWSTHRCAKLSRHKSVEMVDLFEYDSKITTTLTMKKEEDGDFKFYGWSSILEKRNFKTDHIIAFWWDDYHDRLNFKSLFVAYL
ncbi:hypothetical protein EUTSA_v10029394mg [Eutrema salsugineum]|uniref:TF-B3 domain-containing protein n=1 Tax=Eutrema salsugineum TaxID=72664 RepID=V4L3H0_EUTSA|nr:hypothetical protein EUTSA_v10029394mg [Eutrema salsugineum]